MTSSRLQRSHKKIIEAYRYEGFRFLIWRILIKCLAPLGALYVVWLCKKDLREPLEDFEAKIPVKVVHATEGDLDAIAAMVARRKNQTQSGFGWYRQRGIRETIIERFQRGDKCFLGKVGQEIAHFNWIFLGHTKPISWVDHHVELKADEAMCNDGFTEEIWRGKSVHRIVNQQMLRFLKISGYRTAFTSVGVDGLIAQKALRRIGWRFSTLMVCFIPRVSNKQWFWQVEGFIKKMVNFLFTFHH